MIDSASKLIQKSEEYSIQEFKADFQTLIDSYNDLPELDIDKIRNEIYDWDFSLEKDALSDFNKVCEAYARFVEYQNRITKLVDETKMHENTLEFIIKSVKDIASQFYSGTKQNKDSKTSTMLMQISLLHNNVVTLSNLVGATQKSIEYNSQQLARILREREAMTKINNVARNVGLAEKYGMHTKPRTIVSHDDED